MKRILLASTALVAFGGAAAADGHAADGIALSGSAELSYNTGGTVAGTTTTAMADWDGEIDVALTRGLDNGLTAGASFGFEFADNNAGATDGQGQTLDSKDFVLSLTSETSGLYFGNTGTAQDQHFSAAGDMESDGFSSEDGHMVLRSDATFGSVDTSLSYFYDETAETLRQLGVGASATFGSVDVAFGYQEEVAAADAAALIAIDDDFVADQVWGLSVGTTLGGADLGFAYAQDGDSNSTGLEISYPIGDAVTVGAYYVSESVGDDNYGVDVDFSAGAATVNVYYRQEQANDDYGFDVDYDLGNGAALFAGYAAGTGSDDGYYLGGSYDLGSGAEIRLVHVEAANLDGDNEYFGDDDKIGTTLSLSFAF